MNSIGPAAVFCGGAKSCYAPKKICRLSHGAQPCYTASRSERNRRRPGKVTTKPRPLKFQKFHQRISGKENQIHDSEWNWNGKEGFIVEKASLGRLPSETRKARRHTVLKQMKANYFLYLFLLPATAYLLIFSYGPMYGIQIAFKDFYAYLGIEGSPWVGWKHFENFFRSPRFSILLQNTLTLSFYSLLAGFPLPIILALLLNYTPKQGLKKFAQTASYAPHFISTVVLVGMLNVFFSPRSGFINTMLGWIGIDPIFFLGDPKWFKHMYVWSGVWQSTGWGSIIYLAALAGVSPELHEAAIIDGANKLQRIWNIDIPTIMPTMVILLVMNFGSIMNVGYEKVFLMQNDLNMSASEIISTYTYKIGLQGAQYSYSTAIGLFNNVVNFVMLVVVNRVARSLSGSSLW